MKKILLLAVVSLCLFAACSDDNPVEQPFFAIDGETSATVGNTESILYVNILSSSPIITTTPSQGWISVTLNSSNDLERIYTYKVTVEINSSDDVRNGKITFTQTENGLTATFNITQLADGSFLVIEGESEFEVSNEAGKFVVTISSSLEVTATPSEGWISIALKSSQAPTYTYEVTVTENATNEARDGEVTFQQTTTGLTANVTITQAATPRIPETVGMYVLAEGSWGNGNGQLIYFDFDKASNTFVKNNSRTKNLGDTPNDMVLYGSKIYVAVTGASAADASVKVFNAETGNLLQTIPTPSAQPRRIVAHNGKVYLSMYPNFAGAIDTLSYNYTSATLSGTYPEGLCVHNGSLYICNSGYGAGNTISVVDINSFTETTSITVPVNPANIIAVGNELYLNTLGDYVSVPSNLHVVNPSTKTITKTFDIGTSSIVAGEEYVYASFFDWDTFGDSFHKISITAKAVSEFASDAIDDMDIMMSNRVSINPLNGEIFVTQQMGDWVTRLNSDGETIEVLKTGVENGNTVVFFNK